MVTLTDEEQKKVAHAWRTIGLILYKHREQFSPEEWMMLAKSSGEFYSIREIPDAPDYPNNWPATDFEKWEAMK